MNKTRFKLLKNLMVYLIVLGMVFGTPVSHVFAAEPDDSGNGSVTEASPTDGEEIEIPVTEEETLDAVPQDGSITSMEFTWAQGQDGNIIFQPSGDYSIDEILDGSQLNVTYSDGTSEVYTHEGYYFVDSNGDNVYEVHWGAFTDGWTVGTEDYIYIYADGNYEPMCSIPIKIVADPDVVSWGSATMQHCTDLNPEAMATISVEGNMVSFYAKDRYNNITKLTGVLAGIDIPYKSEIEFTTNQYQSYYVFAKSEQDYPIIDSAYSSYGNNFTVSNGIYPDGNRYYILFVPEDDLEKLEIETSKVSSVVTFDDIKDNFPAMEAGKSNNISGVQSQNWVYFDPDTGNSYDENGALLSFTVPAHKAISFDALTTSSYLYNINIYGDNGDAQNSLYHLSYNYDTEELSLYEGYYSQIDYIVNPTNEAHTYYLASTSDEAYLNFSYVDYYTGDVSLYPNWLPEMEQDDYDPHVYTVDGFEDTYLYLYKNEFTDYDHKYYISEWEDRITCQRFPSDSRFYLQEDRDYELNAIWTEYDKYNVTLHSNYPAGSGMEETTITEAVYVNKYMNLGDYTYRFEPPSGYKISGWYYYDGDKKEYITHSFCPEEDTDIYAEWEPTDDYLMIEHSNYPEGCGLEDVTYYYYASGDEYYISGDFETPKGYRLDSYKTADGTIYEYSYVDGVDSGMEFWTNWKKNYKVTFHSNYPEQLGKEEETQEDIDYGDGISLGWKFDSENQYVYITGYSTEPDGDPVTKSLYDKYYPTDDTDLYALWQIPECNTYHFHSAYPVSWEKDEVVVDATQDFEGATDLTNVYATITGEGGATIVGWEDEYGFQVYTDEDFDGHYYFSDGANFFAVWSTRPKVTINTNFPAGYEEVGPKTVTYYADRSNNFYTYDFKEAYSVSGYAFRLKDKKTGKYYYNTDYNAIPLTENVEYDAEWTVSGYVNIKKLRSSDGSGEYEILHYSDWDGNFTLPDFSYKDPDDEKNYAVDYFEDNAGTKYYPNKLYEKSELKSGTVITAHYTEVHPIWVCYLYNYPDDVDLPDHTTTETDYECTTGTYSINSSLREEMYMPDGYTFVGWADKNGNLVDETKIYTSDVNVTLTGVWEKKGTGITITTQPADAGAMYGNTASFKVVATSTKGNLTYNWQCSSDGGSTWVNVEEADTTATGYNTATLKVISKKALNNTMYRCILKNSKGEATTIAATLTARSIITSNPASAFVKAGETLILPVATRSAAVTCHWQKYNPDTKKWVNLTDKTAKTNELSYKVVAADDGAKFRCKVTNKTEYELSSTAVITVFAIKSQTTSKTAYWGDKAKFTVNLQNGDGAKYQWYVSKDNGSTWAKATDSGNTNATLAVTATKGKNGYKYRCKITCNGKSITSKAALLTTKAIITTQPKNVTTALNKTVTFTVKVSGTSAKTYQWQYYDGSKWNNIKSGTTDTYKVKVTSSNKTRKYRCLVTNGSQKETSASVKATVK